MTAVVAVLAYSGILALLPRIWRAGRISARSAAVILLFNLPILLLAILAFVGVPLWAFALAGVLLLTVPLVYFRFVVSLLDDARTAASPNGTLWSGFSRVARWTIPALASVPSLIFMLVFGWLSFTNRLL